jgi:hypothetical protein
VKHQPLSGFFGSFRRRSNQLVWVLYDLRLVTTPGDLIRAAHNLGSMRRDHAR